MTLEEHIAKLEKDILISKSRGDWVSLHGQEDLRDCLKKIKPSEYKGYIRSRLMYGASSVRPVPLNKVMKNGKVS